MSNSLGTQSGYKEYLKLLEPNETPMTPKEWEEVLKEAEQLPGMMDPPEPNKSDH